MNNLKLVPEVNLKDGRKYQSADVTDIRERFRTVDANWNRRPAHLEPRKSVRDRLNGWA